MADNKLTVKQEKFIVNVFKGMTQRDAYIDAYNAHYAVETIDANASRLARTEKVSQRLAELREQVISDAVMSVTERKERLSQLAREDVKKPLTGKEVVLSVAELNKMEHIYDELTPVGTTIVNSFTFILPDGTKVSPKQLMEVNPAEGNNEQRHSVTKETDA